MFKEWYQPPPGKEVAHKAAHEAAVRRVADNERLRLAGSSFRVAGVYSLATYAAFRATTLDQLVVHDDSRLAAIHQGFEQAAAVIATQIIQQFGSDI